MTYVASATENVSREMPLSIESRRPALAEPSKVRATVARSPLFAGLPISAIEDLANRVVVRSVPAGSTIVKQDDRGDALFLIVTGRVKSVMYGNNGREVVLGTHRAGDSFGELSVVDGDPRSSSCLAIEPCMLLVLSRDSLFSHITTYPQTGLNMMSELAKRVRRADETIAQLALCDVNERLIHKLIALAKEEGTATPEGLMVPRLPTQQELASMVGSCRETISRAFNQLVKSGAIISRGRALVVTPHLMETAKAA